MLKSGERWGHSTSPLRETRRAGNICCNLTIATRAVWAVALSCWNQMSSRFVSSIILPIWVQKNLPTSQDNVESWRWQIFHPPQRNKMNICEFFLWGYLKEKVFRSRPQNLEKLKMRIREEISAIPLEMCQRAAENFRHRLQLCIASDGHHLHDTIFKK